MFFPLEDIFTFYQKLPISSQSLTRVTTTKIHCLHHPLCPPYPVTTKGNEEQLLQPVLQSHMCPATLPSAPVLPSGSLHYVPVYNTDKAANPHCLILKGRPFLSRIIDCFVLNVSFAGPFFPDSEVENIVRNAFLQKRRR